MRILSDFTTPVLPTAIALGLFDGVHRGHRAVIANTLGKQPLQSAVLTFDTTQGMPSRKAAAKAIQPFGDRLAALEALGVQVCFAPPFAAICATEPTEFVEKLLFGAMNAKKVCCGEDFRFGAQAKGDVALLRNLCQAQGVELFVVPALMEQGAPISSSRIREALQSGAMATANKLLGRYYTVCGKVIEGRQLGRTMNYPTANQVFDPTICQPKYGVYVSSATIHGVRYAGITNIGIKPTLNGTVPLAETHFLGYHGDLYGQTLAVELHTFVRAEQKFASVEALFAQIAADAETAKAYFQEQ